MDTLSAGKIDGFVKRPISALRFGPRHYGVRSVRLIPQPLQALISNVLRNRRLWVLDLLPFGNP